MIKPQYPYKNEKDIVFNDKIKYYSDENYQIIQKETGRIFDYAIDNYPSKYSYDETDILIDDPMSEIEEKAHAYDIIMGVSE